MQRAACAREREMLLPPSPSCEISHISERFELKELPALRLDDGRLDFAFDPLPSSSLSSVFALKEHPTPVTRSPLLACCFCREKASSNSTSSFWMFRLMHALAHRKHISSSPKNCLHFRRAVEEHRKSSKIKMQIRQG
jgi:hypothetical protein